MHVIGKTGCLLRERMNGRRYSVKHGQDTLVAEHFKKKKQKMVARALQGAQEETTMRRKPGEKMYRAAEGGQQNASDQQG